MTVSPSASRTTTRLALSLAALALSATACADVGSSEIDTVSPTGPAVICQSVRTAIEGDKKAEEAARAAGNEAEAKRKREAVIAGAQGAGTIEGCDVSDLVPPSEVPALPTGPAEPTVVSSG